MPEAQTQTDLSFAVRGDPPSSPVIPDSPILLRIPPIHEFDQQVPETPPHSAEEDEFMRQLLFEISQRRNTDEYSSTVPFPLSDYSLELISEESSDIY